SGFYTASISGYRVLTRWTIMSFLKLLHTSMPSLIFVVLFRFACFLFICLFIFYYRFIFRKKSTCRFRWFSFRGSRLPYLLIIFLQDYLSITFIIKIILHLTLLIRS